jgi:LAO/AO transport system kinase
MGDDIQAIKAGILEIADVLVINKADREGVERLDHYLRAMLNLAPRKEWPVPILRTIASQGEGIDKLADKAEKHLAYLKKSGEYEKRERARLRDELMARVREEVNRRVLRGEQHAGGLQELIKQLEDRSLDLYDAAQLLLKQL